MYVDESGDIGLNNSPTNFFILSGLIINERSWYGALDDLIDLRRSFRKNKGLKLREEIHSSHLLNNPGDLVRIPMYDRVDILKQSIKWINERTYFSVYSVRIDKRNHTDKDKQDIYDMAWRYLIQRFENTLNYKNFNGPSSSDERGLIIADKTDEPKLRSIYRRMRKFNTIPHKRSIYEEGSQIKNIKMIVEDPIHRDSTNSFFIQLADIIAYVCHQKYQANTRARKKGLHNYYNRLSDVLITQISQSKNGILEV